jgi:hypothetical protein
VLNPEPITATGPLHRALLARPNDPDATRSLDYPSRTLPVRRGTRLVGVAKAQHAKPKVNPACHSAPKAE